MAKAPSAGGRAARTETAGRQGAQAAAASFLDDPSSAENQSLRRAIAPMMYGFGDDATPDPEAVEFMRSLVVDYIADITDDAFHIAKIKDGWDESRSNPLLVLWTARRKRGLTCSLLPYHHTMVCQGRFDADCYKWLVRQPKDRHKFERIQELLRVKQEVQEAKDMGKYLAEK
eukprot:scaffold8184_cov258-Pinguiococcus_pyrenoidosus.AAC.3